MDIKEFKDLGIVKIKWDFDEFESSWKEAFISLYIPRVNGYKYGEQYCIKIVFINDRDVITSELFECHKLEFKVLKNNLDENLISMLGLKLVVNKNQFDLIQNIIDKEQNKNMQI